MHIVKHKILIRLCAPTLLVLLTTAYAFAQVPNRSNSLNMRNQRHGDWVILYDEAENEVASADSAEVYRLITYVGGLPKGSVKDFAKTGVLLMECTLVTDRPDSYTGVKTKYKHGLPIEIEVYENGELDIDASISINEQRKAKYKDAKGDEKEVYKQILHDLSELYYMIDEDEKAIALIHQVLKLYESDKQTATSEYSSALYTLGKIHISQRRYLEAKSVYQRMISIDSKLYHADGLDYARSLSEISFLLMERGEIVEAKSYLEDALKIHLVYLEKGDKDLILTLNRLGRIYKRLGEYDKAEPMLREALESYQTEDELRSADYATSLHNYGLLLKALGDMDKSVEYMTKALTLREMLFGTMSYTYAGSMNSLGLIKSEKGEYDTAVKMLTKVAQILKNELGPTHRNYIITLSNTGFVHFKNGNFQEALELFDRCSAYWKKSAGKKSNQYVSLLNDHGESYKFLGDFRNSEKSLRASVKTLEKHYGKFHPSYLKALFHLAELYEMMGSTDKAGTYFAKAIDNVKEQIEKYFPSLSEQEKIAFYLLKKEEIDLYYSFIIKHADDRPELLEKMFEVQLMFKGLLLNSYTKWVNQAKSSGDKELIAQLENFQAKSLLLGKYYSMTREELDERQVDLAQFELEVSTLEKELSKQAKAKLGLSIFEKVSPSQVRDVLKEGEVAIDIIRLDETEFDIDRGESRTAYIGLVITKDGKQPSLVRFPNGHRLETYDIKYYRNCMVHQIKDERSYKEFWKPLDPFLKGADKAYISLDGTFNLINPYTLLDSISGKYVIDMIDLELATNLSDIIENTSRREVTNKSFLCFGDPAYSAPDIERLKLVDPEKVHDIRVDSIPNLLPSFRVPQLPNARLEAELVGRRFSEKGWTSMTIIGDMALEEKVKNPPINASVMHFATHGFFDESALHVSGGANHTMLKSGILFAGASYALQKAALPKSSSDIIFDLGIEDGLLTAYEVMNHDLRGVDLVVLSACETARGDIVNGEGVYGLQRAFKIAGVKSLIMSQWPVDDGTTFKTVDMMYEHYLEGDNLHVAFKKALLAVREKHPEPFYWGAFIFVED